MILDKLLSNNKPNEGDKQEVVAKQQHEYKFIGRQRKVGGHTKFSYNKVTGELKKANISHECAIGMDGKPQYEEKVTIEKDCIYFQALNMKNAQKVLKRGYR